MDTEEARQHRFELLATIVMAVAAVATAWSTYQGSRWRGEQAVDTSRATAAHIESSQHATRAGQMTEIDIATFTQWVDATAAGDTQLASFYEARFRDEFQPAFDAWTETQPLTNPDAPLTPFELPEYRLEDTEKAEDLNREATVRSTAAGSANRHANNYMLAVVMFAAALFFAGISSKIRSERQREVLVGLGAVMVVGTAVWIATLPLSFGP